MAKKVIKQFKLIKDRQGVSLLLTLLILTVMLTATLAASNVILRQGRVMKKVTASERSYFAGEVGIEETLYEINKTRQKNINTELTNCWCSTDCNDCQVNYSDGDAQWQVDSIVEDLIDTDDPLEVTLLEGESFQLNIDMMGATYPDTPGADLQFNRTSGGSGQLIVFKENISTGDIFQYGPDSSSSTSTALDMINYYYRFRIRNPSGSGESVTYNVKPLASQDLAVGATITVSSTYKGTNRRVEAKNSKWQIYGQ